MRRVITTLAILLVVVVAGMTALVLLVNPNDFRTYMVQQVEQRSGYQLQVGGDLRWHVWPQLSILAGRMSLTAPGATQPMVTADNMRLDVNLWPLLSHQLSVSQVMLKNAIIRVTPDSAAQKPTGAPVGPGDAEPVSSSNNGWSFNIGKLRLADSLLIWQQPGGDEYNFRDLNLNLDQDASKQASINLATRISRNQRNVSVNLKGQMNVAQYPHRLVGQLDEMNYAIDGANLPTQGIKGTLSGQGEWNGDNQHFSLQKMQLTANDSALEGSADGRLALPQQLNLALHATSLNIDALMANAPSTDNSAPQQANVTSTPVIAEPRMRDNSDSPLNQLDLTLNLTADNSVWRGLTLTNLQLDGSNQQGLMTLSKLQGKFGEGHFSVPGSVDIRKPVTQVAFQPELDNIAIAPLLKALELPETLQGTVSLKGDISGAGLSIEEAKRNWQGSADLEATNLQLSQLNLQQMVRRAVARVSNRVTNDQPDDQGIQQLSGRVTLKQGIFSLPDLQGGNSRLAVQTKGNVDMVKQQLDVTINMMLRGWQGDDKLAALLNQQTIPLRMYGGWNNLQYSLPVDDVVRQQLQSEAKSRLNQWLDRQQPEKQP
ncbi:AsmA protein [Candidatus Pantoea symbiotica]|uniref:AsmA protein n=1 Tax=Candidatus Pantoea symbiotica TaxID=1884370 RepID=A0A1I3WVP7_9GAMM|nr:MULTISPECIES: outer membrane assembly protein AsmA [Pantoea]MRT26872.1 outer membrane assembly protein AsmA [Enterobacteriaceae bacterium RIT697]MRT42162.1 outer membrane assembly protein AsmA [Enterobacteriaceae bacterium RIT702]KAJ9432517.1 outer membrane assembly protein AsmA [Pantoea sp. YR343]SFK11229.1 AsmA protein [Pantoea symbiotica]SFU75692.1 AsmA protein [Pantoea sp. YR525]